MDFPKAEADIFETILKQQHIRKFKSCNVETRIINIILEAANYAPVTNGEDSRAYIVIQDKTMVLGLMAKSFPTSQLDSDNPFFRDKTGDNDPLDLNANTLILIGSKTIGPGHVADCWLAAENIILSAAAMGLGANFLPDSCISLSSSTIKDKLRIPVDFKLVTSIVIGYAEMLTPAVIRSPPLIISWINQKKD